MHRVKIEEDRIALKFQVIGDANARYNSAIIYKDHLLISKGALLKLCDLVNSTCLFEKQVGNSQITQISENSKYIAVVNFDGLVTLLDKEDISRTVLKFRCGGKEIRHSYLDDTLFVVAVEAVEGTEENMLEAYRI